MEIVRTSSFWRDLKNILDYFEEVHAEHAAIRFIDALDETMDFAEKFPDLGNPWESTRAGRSRMRFRLVKGFESYLLFYRHDEEYLIFMHVLHGSQDIEAVIG